MIQSTIQPAKHISWHFMYFHLHFSSMAISRRHTHQPDVEVLWWSALSASQKHSMNFWLSFWRWKSVALLSESQLIEVGLQPQPFIHTALKHRWSRDLLESHLLGPKITATDVQGFYRLIDRIKPKWWVANQTKQLSWSLVNMNQLNLDHPKNWFGAGDVVKIKLFPNKAGVILELLTSNQCFQNTPKWLPMVSRKHAPKTTVRCQFALFGSVEWSRCFVTPGLDLASMAWSVPPATGEPWS